MSLLLSPLCFVYCVLLVLKVKSCPSSFHPKGEFTFNLLNGMIVLNQDLPFRGNTPSMCGLTNTQTYTEAKDKGEVGATEVV